MRRILAILIAASVAVPAWGQVAQEDVSAATGLYLGQTPPDTVPEVFAPEIILDGVHSAPAFSPDGREVYWSRYYTPEGRSRTQHIFTSRLDEDGWTAPEVASFSGVYSDGGPCFTADGNRLFYYTNRPATAGEEPSDEYISDIWYVERTDSGWGQPVRLELNTDKHEGMPSVARDGTLYFQSNRTGARGIFDIFVSEPVEGSYRTATNIGAPITSAQIEFAPFIAPDESYIIFTYNNRPEGNGLHISFRQAAGSWSRPVAMTTINSIGSAQRFPSLSHDGKYLFFTASQDRQGHVYWLDAAIIDQLRPQ